MTRHVDVIKIKQQRGRILTSLNLFHPTPVTLKTLYRTVCDDPTYNKCLFEKDVAYFQQKGYIEFVDDRLGGSDDFYKKVARLTANGKEVAEGTATDPALEI